MPNSPKKRPGRPTKPESERTGNFSVRMPVALREMLERSAQESGRSVNAEIVHRLLSGSSAPPSPDQMKRQVVVDALMEAVSEAIRWWNAVNDMPDVPEYRDSLESAMDDLEMWHARLERICAPK